MDTSMYCKQLLTGSVNSNTSYEVCPNFNIYFKFSCKSTIYTCIQHQNSVLQCLRRTRLPEIQTHVEFTFQQFLCDEQSNETINEQLKNWLVNDTRRQKFIDDEVLKKAREVVNSKPDDHNVVYLDFDMWDLHVHLVHERLVMDVVLQRSMEEEKSFMVPALESSIEALSKMLVNQRTCSICLEDFSSNGELCEGVLMPCKHVFHGNCINKWLRTSHYCPVCRYRMPTEVDA